jgi:LuxR family maltose regulon positive regulatory protein
MDSLPLIATRLPPSIRLLLVSRSAPSPALLETRLFEVLTQDDLLFSLEELEWLGEEKNIPLTPPEVRALRETTGGWAMYLSAILSGKQNLSGKQGETPQTLTQYLQARVWEPLEREKKETLLRLAIPTEVTPELAGRLLAQADGRGVLERLVYIENAFLSNAGDDTYRFHDVFRDFLLERAALFVGKDEIRRLNAVAAQWYYERGDFHAGVRHYIENRDHEGVSRCLEAAAYYHAGTNVMAVEFLKGFTDLYIKPLPEEFITGNPYLIYRSSLAAYHNGDAKEHQRYLAMLHEKMPEIKVKYPGLVETIGFHNGVDPRISFREYTRGLLKLIPKMPRAAASKEKTRASTLTQNLPFFHRSMRDFSEYHEVKPEDIQMLEDTFGVMIGRDYHIMEQALIAGMYYERGELLEAARYALIGYNACDDGLSSETLFVSAMIVASILYAMGDLYDAGQVMEKTEAFINERAQFLRSNFRALQTERAIRNGNTEAAREWLAVYAYRGERRQPELLLPFYQICRHFTTLRSYIAVGDFTSAAEFGGRLQTLATEYIRPLDQIESGLLTAIALWRGGKESAAVEQMAATVRIAMPYSFTQLFINEGKEIQGLLWALKEKMNTAAETSPPTEAARFVDKLITRICGGSFAASFGGVKPESEKPLKLSSMRRKMLAFLNKGMTYSEIAAATNLERATIKRHVLLLYKQLGVHNAQDAITKAKMLGVI